MLFDGVVGSLQYMEILAGLNQALEAMIDVNGGYDGDLW